MNQKLKVVSLFSGGMGMDIGLQQAGLDVLVSQDFDRHCVSTMRANAAHAVVPGDIKALFAGDPAARFLTDAAGVPSHDVSVLVGGPPCQSFSNAGKRQGLSDLRGTLFQEFALAVEAIRPRFFIMENVAAIGSKSMPGVLAMILERFHSARYSTCHGVLDASDYGTAQKRLRLIIIGSRDGEQISIPRPTHSDQPGSDLMRKSTVRDVIADLMGDEGPRLNFSARTMKYIRMVPAGGNWRNLPEHLQNEALGNAYHSGGGKTGFFRRLPWDGQSPTLVTSPVGRMSLLAHPCEDRPLSVREYARIQGFPDAWEFQGPIGARYRQVGNAVAVPLARAIGRHILEIASSSCGLDLKAA